MKILELLTSDSDTIRHTPKRIASLTKLTMHLLHFTFTVKRHVGEVERVDEALKKELQGTRGGRVAATITAQFRRYHHDENLPTWGLRLLEAFKLLRENSNHLSPEDVAAIRRCIGTTMSLARGDIATKTDLLTRAAEYLRLFNDYAILPVEDIALATVKNMLMRVQNMAAPVEQVELQPGTSIELVRVDTQRAALDNPCDEKTLADLTQRAYSYLDIADSTAATARSAKSLAGFLLTAKACVFYNQVACWLLRYIVAQCEHRTFRLPDDSCREQQVAEENRAEISQVLQSDCSPLLLGPITTACGEVAKVGYACVAKQLPPNRGYVDIALAVRTGMYRNPAYPEVLAEAWPQVFQKLDITGPIDFSGISAWTVQNLQDQLLATAVPHFIRSFTDRVFAVTTLEEMIRWKSIPNNVVDPLIYHERDHADQNRYWAACGLDPRLTNEPETQVRHCD